MAQHVIGVVGWKNNGKTTLVERMVRWLTAEGRRVSTVKHAHHSVDLDAPGRDSFRHREAGAVEVLLATGRRWAVMRELRHEPEPELVSLLARLEPVDLVIVEGFKAGPQPKIEAHLRARGTPLIAHTDPSVIAIASDAALEIEGRPVFPLDDIPAIARFALERASLL
jgi:molybdopterin-guanine dinucleotide biosynthesis protein B